MSQKTYAVQERYPWAQFKFLGDDMDGAIIGAVHRHDESPRVIYSLDACKFLSYAAHADYMERIRAIEGFLETKDKPAPLFLIQPPGNVFRHIVREHRLVVWDALFDAVLGVALEGATPVAIVYDPVKAEQCLADSQVDSDDNQKTASQTLHENIMAANLGEHTPFFIDMLNLQ